MKNKHYPTRQELNQFWWYRLGQVTMGVIVALAIISSNLTGSIWYFDGVINGLFWYFALLILWLIIKYIIFGKNPNTIELQKERKATLGGILYVLIIVIIYLLIVWSQLTAK